jgi:hypothetical protein
MNEWTCGRFFCSAVLIHSCSRSALPSAGVRSWAKARTKAASWFISAQALVVLARSSCWSGRRVSGRLSSSRASLRGDRPGRSRCRLQPPCAAKLARQCHYQRRFAPTNP